MFHSVKFMKSTAATKVAPTPMRKSTGKYVALKKYDEELQVVWAEVYAPGVPDSQGDFMDADGIRRMAYDFMAKSSMDSIDTQHSREKNGAYIVESFIAREDDTVFIPGAWVLGVKVPDNEWEMVKSGELNGFSMDGFGYRVEKDIELELDDVLKGETEVAEDHTHTFYVKYDSEFKFLGGDTSPGPDGHVHKIIKGTATEVTNGHSHRFDHITGAIRNAS